MKIFLFAILLALLSGCSVFGGGSSDIDVEERMAQAKEQGGCVPAAIYEETEDGKYKKAHKFAMICK